jgi:hypothetical protein
MIYSLFENFNQNELNGNKIILIVSILTIPFLLKCLDILLKILVFTSII